MISDKERREVARKLRSLDERIDGVPLLCTKQEHDAMALCAIRAVVGKGDIFHLLADLIEPQERTCKIEGTYEDEYGIYDHLTCGHVAMRQWPEPTSYCPHCGAEVVRSED